MSKKYVTKIEELGLSISMNHENPVLKKINSEVDILGKMMKETQILHKLKEILPECKELFQSRINEIWSK